jgi:hypothetical protein
MYASSVCILMLMLFMDASHWHVQIQRMARRKQKLIALLTTVAGASSDALPGGVALVRQESFGTSSLFG